LKYTDPSGHNPECGPDGIYCDNTVSFEEKYGISFTGETAYWTDSRKAAVMAAVKLVAARFGGSMGTNGANAWAQVYGNVEFEWDSECYNCRTEEIIAQCGNNFAGECAAGGAYTESATHIIFASMTGEAAMQSFRMVKNVVHELGHAFDNSLGNQPRLDLFNNHRAWIDNRERILAPNPVVSGYERLEWQQNKLKVNYETFADMFIGWAYNTWNNDPANANDVKAAQTWMNSWVP
jgi:hypothetical protein